ncbi:MAG: ATP-binding protein [Acidobacteriota bacterium]
MQELNAEQTAALDQAASREMARLSRAGIVFYPLICLVVGLAGGAIRERPIVFVPLVASAFGLGILRVLLVLHFDRVYGASPERWFRLFAFGLVLTIAIWTVISCWTLYVYGISGLAIFAMLASVMMADQSITIYTSSRPLMSWVLAILTLPHGVMLWRTEAPAIEWIAGMTLAYGIYLWMTGRRLHASYWQGLRDGKMLELRAAELAEHRARLESLVDERTASLAEAVERLEVKNGEIEAKKAEVEVRKSEVEAKSAELERFTYTVSHDLKSPLITVRGFLGLLKQDALSGDVERMERDIERIEGAVQTMGQLLEQLLELSRIGRMVNPPQDVALAELVREAVVRVAGSIKERGVEIEIGEDLPQVHGDRARLLEVFEHLIDNAVRFLGETDAPRILVEAQEEGGEVLCAVRDNGIGIDPRDHQRVFDLFEQLGRGEGSGTGIGLALVQRIVEVHHGRVWIESGGEGQGTTVRFTLPRASPAA